MPLSPPDAHYVLELVRSRAAIVIDERKDYLIEQRLAPLARQVGAASTTELIAAVRSGAKPHLRDEVVDAFTTNETSWFRDKFPFEAMRTELIPALLAARAPSRTLNVWCGAASTGQEPYSLAILLREHFPQLAGGDVRIVATDLSRAALAQAREGRYGQMEINRGLPAALIPRYFSREGTKFVLRPEVRQMVEFRELNLAGPWTGLPRADLVLLRNVLIYFAAPTKADILNRIAATVLRSDGYLFLGGAETTHTLTDRFERVQRGSCAWYQLKGGPKS